MDLNYTYLGVSIRKDISNYISLYTAYMELNKSSVLRILIKEWFKKNKAQKTEVFLIKELTKRIQNVWDEEKDKREHDKRFKNRSFKSFKLEQETELKKRKISQNHISQIINKLIYEKN